VAGIALPRFHLFFWRGPGLNGDRRTEGFLRFHAAAVNAEWVSWVAPLRRWRRAAAAGRIRRRSGLRKELDRLYRSASALVAGLAFALAVGCWKAPSPTATGRILMVCMH
jgi:hypothetical protein